MAEPAGALPLALDDLAAGFAACLRPGATGLVLAVSGGPDSVALMQTTVRLAAQETFAPLTVATVDHGLREGSAAEADAVMAAAAALGLPARRLVWTGAKPTRAIQEAAREARYALLAACCRDVGADHLVTAHTRDDQAGTVLFRLLRGSGPAGLAGMKATSDLGGGLTHVRPLLRVEKARLVAACTRHGWPFATDPSNVDPRFARPRLRRLMPMLAAEGLGLDALERLADRAARAEAALAATADALAADLIRQDPDGTLDLDMRRLAAQPAEMAVRLLGRALALTGHDRPVRLDRLERAATLLRAAAIAGEAHVLTLHGTIARLTADGRLMVRPEGLRRRGTGAPAPVQARVKHNDGPSLGKGGSGPYIGA